MLEVRRPIVNFHLLVLGVLSNATPGGIHGSPWVTPTLSKESLDSTPGKGSLTAWFRRLCWRQRKLILPRRNKVANGVWLEQVAPAVCIEVIFTLLVGLRVWDDWLEPGGTNPCRTCHRLKVFLGILGGNWGGNWTSCIARCGSPLFGGVPKSIWIAVPKRERGGAFLREQEPDAIAAKFGIVLTELFQTGWLTRWVWRN